MTVPYVEQLRRPNRINACLCFTVSRCSAVGCFWHGNSVPCILSHICLMRWLIRLAYKTSVQRWHSESSQNVLTCAQNSLCFGHGANCADFNSAKCTLSMPRGRVLGLRDRTRERESIEINFSQEFVQIARSKSVNKLDSICCTVPGMARDAVVVWTLSPAFASLFLSPPAIHHEMTQYRAYGIS